MLVFFFIWIGCVYFGYSCRSTWNWDLRLESSRRWRHSQQLGLKKATIQTPTLLKSNLTHPIWTGLDSPILLMELLPSKASGYLYLSIPLSLYLSCWLLSYWTGCGRHAKFEHGWISEEEERKAKEVWARWNNDTGSGKQFYSSDNKSHTSILWFCYWWVQFSSPRFWLCFCHEESKRKAYWIWEEAKDGFFG